jgi:hypothetical protein
MDEFKTAIDQQFATSNQLLLDQRTQINELRESIRDSDSLVRTIDDNTATTQRELRNDVYEMEKELNSRVRELDEAMRSNREDTDKKITEILANPLNVVE